MSETSWLTDDEAQAWLSYRRMRTLLDLAIARDLRADSGLSEADYDVLSTLSEAPDNRWRAGDLAGRLLWSTSRLAHQVGRMQERGLVSRHSVDDDARGAVIALTPAGLRILGDAAALHVRSVRRHLIDRLSPAEVRTLGRITARVVAGLSE